MKFWNVKNTATGEVYRIWAVSGESAVTMVARLKDWRPERCVASEDCWEEG